MPRKKTSKKNKESKSDLIVIDETKNENGFKFNVEGYLFFFICYLIFVSCIELYSGYKYHTINIARYLTVLLFGLIGGAIFEFVRGLPKDKQNESKISKTLQVK